MDPSSRWPPSSSNGKVVQEVVQPEPTWVGPFVSWEMAGHQRARLYPISDRSSFDSVSWLGRQQGFARQLMALAPGELPSPLQRASNLPLLVAGSSVKRVVDLGGGSGWPHTALASLGPPLEDYVVVDNPEVCRYFQTLTNPPVRHVSVDFLSGLIEEDLLAALGSERFDVVYANSSIQYAVSNQFLTDLLRVTKPVWVLLDDVPMALGSEDAFVIQLNSDVPQVARFISAEMLRKDLKVAGYALCWRTAFAQPGHVNWVDTSDPSVVAPLSQPESFLFRKIRE